MYYIYFHTLFFTNFFVVCSEGYFKLSHGHESCEECPDNSNSTTSGATSCTCLTGYYRSRYEDVTTPCTGEYLVEQITAQHLKLTMCSCVVLIECTNLNSNH